jgi:hypothetical protein
MPHVSLDATPPNLSGVSPEFAARLSAEDLEDIKAGDNPEPVTAETEGLQAFFEEHAGILEYDAGLSRTEAEREAAKIAAILARNRGHLWASLWVVLSQYPALLAQVPDTPGSVDALPPVVRQGTFVGSQAVKA